MDPTGPPPLCDLLLELLQAIFISQLLLSAWLNYTLSAVKKKTEEECVSD